MSIMFSSPLARLGFSFALAAASYSLFAFTAGAVAAQKPRRYLVRLQPLAGGPATLHSLSARFAVKPHRVFSHALQGFSADLTPAQAAALKSDPRVADIQPDRVARLIAHAGSAKVVSSKVLRRLKRNQQIPTGISRCGADKSPTAAIDGFDNPMDVDIAVFDTGIERRHPDLNVVETVNFVGKGAGDPNGHGTHVAGIAAAIDNGIGVVGVAPGARLWSLRVLNRKGFGSWADIVDALDWVAARADQIEVANLSLSDDARADNSIVRSAFDGLAAAGVTIVVAAGNGGRRGPEEATRTIPARYASVIAVSALADGNGEGGEGIGLFKVTRRYYELDESFADFSNYGAGVSLIAPGVKILSTFKNRNYAYLSGTSQATPHVAGAAALYRVKHPNATPSEVRAALRAAGTQFSPIDAPDPDYEPALDVSGF